MPTNRADDKAVFYEALSFDSEDDQQTHLKKVCGDDVGQFDRVTALLGAYAQDSEFLEVPASGLHQALPVPQPLKMPKRIGPYRIREQIGEGGMGVIYLAEQTTPVRRRVALKVIKPGMDSRQVLARFDAERQALAIMNHSGIARIFDAGMTSEGRPYFVMELTRGVSIDTYCDESKVPLKDRLNLFIDVCAAVQHAHQKGIIHRDLKPSNVLITLHDNVPVVKVIDFGIAKALDHNLTERTLFTHASEMIGTPAYMSPEQIERNGIDVDTRSDVYSLGVLLYKLLVGVTPFDKDTLNSASPDEMRRIIRDDDPIRPSRRFSTLDNKQASTITELRGIDTRQLSLSMQRELDWVVMKALEKDRSRRYDSVGALAADLNRYLDGDVVQACPPSVGYRLRKLARRNKAFLATALSLVTILLIATGVSISYGTQANVAKELAEDRFVELENRTAELETQRDRADEAAKLAQQNESYARQLAYAADIRLAAQAWDSGDVRQYTDLLDRYANLADGEDLRGFEWRYLRQLGTVRYETIAEGAEGWSCLQHSPDGRSLAAGRSDGVIGLWNASGYEQVTVFQGHKDSVRYVDFSADGNRLASIGDDGMIRLWSVPDAKQTLAMPASEGACRAVHFALDDSVLVSCVESADIQIWDSESGDLVGVLDSMGEDFRRFAVSGDGLFCIGGGTRRCFVWDLNTRKRIQNVSSMGHVRCLEVTLDNGNFAAAFLDHSIGIRSLDKPRNFVTESYVGHDDDIQNIAFHPDGTTMASGDRAGVIRTWKLDRPDGSVGENDFQNLPPVFRGHSSRTWAIDYSPTGDRLVSASRDGTIRAWSARTNPVEDLKITSPCGAVFSTTGDELIVSGSQGITVWNRRTHQSRSFATEQNWGLQLALSPDGKTVATNHKDGSIRLWDMRTGKVVRQLRAHESGFAGLEFSPDGSRLVSAGGKDGTCKLWDFATGELTRVIHTPPHCRDATFAPDGQTFAISTENDAMIHDTQSGRCLHLLQGHQNTADCVAFSPDGRWLATGSHDRTIRIWETSTGELKHVIPAHKHKVLSIAISPDGLTIASGDREGRIAFSHVNTGRFLFDRKVSDGAIDSLKFSPDGNALILVNDESHALLLTTNSELSVKE